jgi:putative phosphoribosyl transferase
VFADRRDAGRRLAMLLGRLRADRPVVLGMPRGGVPVAAEVARALDAPLDVVLVRKVGAPQSPEYAIGAVAEGGVRLVDETTAHTLGLSDADMHALIARAEGELAEQTRRYRAGREPAALDGRTAILVDDGLATGRSAHAAIRALRRRGAARVILAVPVAAPESVRALRGVADEIVCVETPPDLWAVGVGYEDFRPIADEHVAALLAHARREPGRELKPPSA